MPATSRPCSGETGHGHGLDDLYRDLKGTLKEVAEQILAHQSTVQPRREDLPAVFNGVGDGDFPAGSVTVAAGQTETVNIRARSGHTLHLSSLSVLPSDPAADRADSAITAHVAGRLVAQTHEQPFHRPLMVDRNDVLTLRVTNNAGGPQTFHYVADGWLRRNIQRL